jgi:hypothetical protein
MVRYLKELRVNASMQFICVWLTLVEVVHLIIRIEFCLTIAMHGHSISLYKTQCDRSVRPYVVPFFI